MNKAFFIVFAVVSVLLAFAGSVAFEDAMQTAISLENTRFLMRWLFLTICLFAAFAIMRYLIAYAAETSAIKAFYAARHLSTVRKWKGGLFVVTLVFCAAWSPYLVAMWPGNLDTSITYQLAQFFAFVQSGDISIIDFQSPLFGTFVYGFIANMVYIAFGNIEAALFAAVLLQYLCFAFALSLFINLAYKHWKISQAPLVILLVVCAILPLFPMMACTLSNAGAFSWLNILFFTALIDMAVCLKEKIQVSVGTIVILALSALFMGLASSTGSIVAAVAILATVILRFKDFSQWTQTVLPAFLLTVVAACVTFVLPLALGLPGIAVQDLFSTSFEELLPSFSDTTIRQVFDNSSAAAYAALPGGYSAKPLFSQEGSAAIQWFYEGMCQVPFVSQLFTGFVYVIFMPLLLLIILIVTLKLRDYCAIALMIIAELALYLLAPVTEAALEMTCLVMPFVSTMPLMIATCILAMKDRMIELEEAEERKKAEAEKETLALMAAPETLKLGAGGVEEDAGVEKIARPEVDIAAMLDELTSGASDEKPEDAPQEEPEFVELEIVSQEQPEEAPEEEPQDAPEEELEDVPVVYGAHSVVKGKKVNREPTEAPKDEPTVESQPKDKPEPGDQPKKKAKPRGKQKKSKRGKPKANTDDVVIDFGNTGEE